MKPIYILLALLLTGSNLFAQKTAETLPATNITAHCATLNGKIIGAQTDANLTFFVGESLTAPMQPTAWIKKTTTADSPFSFEVCNLKCNTVYHFRFCSTGFSEFPCGETLIFKTLDTISCATSVADAEWQQQLKIYPNPVADVLHISLPGIASYTLCDAFGRTINANTFSGNTAISTLHLSPGWYILKINTNNGTVVQKILKE